jgi:hypothetical protein
MEFPISSDPQTLEDTQATNCVCVAAGRLLGYSWWALIEHNKQVIRAAAQNGKRTSSLGSGIGWRLATTATRKAMRPKREAAFDTIGVDHVILC